jgi:hypothetical protein
MIKKLFSILVSDVKLIKFFFLTCDVIIYRRNRFHESKIKVIMILKKIFDANRSRKTNEISWNLTNILLNDEEKRNIIEFSEWVNESNDITSQVEENIFVNMNDEIRLFEYSMNLRDSFFQRTERRSSLKNNKVNFRVSFFITIYIED